MGKRLLEKNIHTHRCLCVMTRWEPGVRRESFIQGVKMENLCGENATVDPFLSSDTTLCLKEDPCRTGAGTSLKGKVLQGFPFFYPDFFLFWPPGALLATETFIVRDFCFTKVFNV